MCVGLNEILLLLPLDRAAVKCIGCLRLLCVWAVQLCGGPVQGMSCGAL